MLLAIDIGNSSTKFGIYNRNTLSETFAIETAVDPKATKIKEAFEKSHPKNIDGIIISSVVAEAIAPYKSLSTEYFGIEPIFVDHTFDFGFSIEYSPPEDCGADRLVGGFAAIDKYSAPLIVCDFGTATTIDFVNNDNEYIGGIIAPGPDTFAKALFDNTSKLPKVAFEKPVALFGGSTVGSIQSGIYYGYIGLVDGLIRRMFEESKSEPKVIATGGFANVISQDSDFVKIVEPNLILDGLRKLFYKQNR